VHGPSHSEGAEELGHEGHVETVAHAEGPTHESRQGWRVAFAIAASDRGCGILGRSLGDAGFFTMPITYEVDAWGRVLSLATGSLDVQTLRAHLTRLSADPARANPLCELLDATAVTSVGLWTADVIGLIEFATRHRATLGDARVALVATNDTVYGVGRIGESLGDLSHLTFRVFRERERAMRWQDQLEPGLTGADARWGGCPRTPCP